MSMMTHDLRFALRTLRRKPGYTAVVILTLAIGIGLNTAIFSIVNGVLLRPLPYPKPDQLVWGYGSFSRGAQAAVSPPDFLDYRERSSAFDVLAARRGVGTVALTGLDAPQLVGTQTVSAGFFEALGARPILGRTFVREDETDATNNIVVLDHGFWSRTLGADPRVLDRTLTLDGEPYHVVGVMPRGFQLFGAADAWVPIAFDSPGNQVRRFHNVQLVGRLAGGLTLEQAQADVDVIARQLEAAYPESNDTWRLQLRPLHEIAVGSVRPALTVLSCAVVLVLLIACGNVANLTLARGATRAPELAVRIALGAGRDRLIRQLLAESTVLAVAGGVLGVGLAIGGVQVLRWLQPGNIPRIDEAGVDIVTLAFALLISLVTGVVFGLLPAIRSSQLDLQRGLKAGGRSEAPTGGGLRGGLVAAQVALSLVLLVGAALLMQSFWRLNSVEPGFDPDHLAIASLALPAARYDDERLAAFEQTLTERFRALPGVLEVGATNILPLTGRGNDTYLAVPGRHQLGTDTQFNAQTRSATPDYFPVMGIPVLRGRNFTGADHSGSAPVVIIDQPFVDRIFPDQDPIGQRLLIDFGDPHEAEIVGVVGGVQAFGLGGNRPLTFYLPFAQFPSDFQEFVLRTSGDPRAVLSQVPAAVESIDPLQPVAATRAYVDVVGRTLAQPRFQMFVLGFFAAVALGLAALGIYGVLGYYVSQRRREVGLRVALGAGRSEVYRLVVGHGMTFAGIGLLIGIAGALALTRFMSGILFGVSATDPLAFAVVPLILIVTALLASYLPARRAARIDPVRVLRE